MSDQVPAPIGSIPAPTVQRFVRPPSMPAPIENVIADLLRRIGELEAYVANLRRGRNVEV